MCRQLRNPAKGVRVLVNGDAIATIQSDNVKCTDLVFNLTPTVLVIFWHGLVRLINYAATKQSDELNDVLERC